MELRTRTVASGCAALALGVALAASAQPALARWTFHDSSIGETITAPAGGTRSQTCTDRLLGAGGWATFVDVENGEDPAEVVIPPGATSRVDYEVWKAPAGFDSFNLASEDDSGVYFEDTDGTRHPAASVGRVTTPPRSVLRAPRPANGDSAVSDNFVFTSASISLPLRGVAPGDVLGLRPAGHGGGIFVNVVAMDCSLPVLKAKADVVPGSATNVLQPKKPEELVPVRVFGRSGLAVRRITEVHLGQAPPASVPPELQPSMRPADVNGDGRLDRLYYFRQGDTDVMCDDTSVTLTGLTSDRKRFQARSPIATSCTA